MIAKHADEISSLKTKIEELEGNISSTQEEKTTLQTQNTELSQKIEELTKNLTTSEQQLLELQNTQKEAELSIPEEKPQPELKE